MQNNYSESVVGNEILNSQMHSEAVTDYSGAVTNASPGRIEVC